MHWKEALTQALRQIVEDLGSYFDQVGAYLPNFLMALAVLLFGWMAAWLLGNIVAHTAARIGSLRRRLKAARLEEIAETDEQKRSRERAAHVLGRATYYFLVICIMGVFFNIVNVPTLSEPLRDVLLQLMDVVPRLVHAFLILGVAWIVAALLSLVVKIFLTASRIDERMAGWRYRSAAEEEKKPGTPSPKTGTIAETGAKLVFYFVLLFALPGFLSALAIEGMATPIRDMFEKSLALLPNLFGAAFIILIGWIVGRVVRGIVSSFLVAAGLDRSAENAGVTHALGGLKASTLVGFIVFVFVLLPFITLALDNIQWTAISEPARNTLDRIVAMVPPFFAASAVFLLGFFAGKLAGQLATRLLLGMGFDGLLARLGLGAIAVRPGEGISLSSIAGKAVAWIVLLFATAEAFDILHLRLISEMFSRFLLFLPQLFVGLLILGVGFAVAQAVARMAAVALRNSPNAHLLSNAAKYGIITFGFFMALQHIGLAESIIVTAFSALFGALCLALALAFGLGARGIATEYLEQRFGQRPPAQRKP